MPIHPEEMTPAERAAVLSRRLTLGATLTVKQVQGLLGYRCAESARYCLNSLSRVIPIYETDDGIWQMCDLVEPD